MFRTEHKLTGTPVRIRVDGQWQAAIEGQMLAAVLLAAGVDAFRRDLDGRPRLPYCLMGVCQECLVSIDGVPARQACQVVVSDGMQVETASGQPRR